MTVSFNTRGNGNPGKQSTVFNPNQPGGSVYQLGINAPNIGPEILGNRNTNVLFYNQSGNTLLGLNAKIYSNALKLTNLFGSICTVTAYGVFDGAGIEIQIAPNAADEGSWNRLKDVNNEDVIFSVGGVFQIYTIDNIYIRAVCTTASDNTNITVTIN